MTRQSCLIKPTAVMMPFGPSVEVYLFGRPLNWSLKHNLEEASQNIATFASGKGVRTILAPKADFSARLCERKELLQQTINVSVGGDEKVEILRGAYGDAAEVSRGEAFFVGSADCPTLLVYNSASRLLTCAHTGRDSLFDRNALLHDGERRPYASIVDAIMSRQIQHGADKNSHDFISTYTLCGIGKSSFDHPWNDPEKGEENKTMSLFLSRQFRLPLDEGGRLSLKALITRQLREYALRPDAIGQDSIDTFLDVGDDKKPIWWSNRRGDKEERNGVLVIHR